MPNRPIQVKSSLKEMLSTLLAKKNGMPERPAAVIRPSLLTQVRLEFAKVSGKKIAPNTNIDRKQIAMIFLVVIMSSEFRDAS